jgi:ATP-dependent protease HslVU (ClpYQ) ATPase subunit
MASTKAMTLRIDADRHAELEAVAQTNNQSVTDVIRDGIDLMIQNAKNDKEFQVRLKASMERNARVLERLAG